MPTLCIRYRIDPLKVDAFERYATSLAPIVDRCGGRFIDYYLPTKLAGPTDTAFGLIDFTNLAEYEAYRERLATDADAVAVAGAAQDVILSEDRSFLKRAKRTDKAA